MGKLSFDTENFNTTITNAIQEPKAKVDDLKLKIKTITSKIDANERKITSLEMNRQKVSSSGDLANESYDEYEIRLNEIAAIESKRKGLASFNNDLKEAKKKYEGQIAIAKKELFKAFKEAVESYVLTEQKPLLEVLQGVIDVSHVCHDSVLSFYNQVIEDAGIDINGVGFSFSYVKSHIYPMHGKLHGMQAMLDEARAVKSV
jgi:uncharacterized protein (DUF2164 family)